MAPGSPARSRDRGVPGRPPGLVEVGDLRGGRGRVVVECGALHVSSESTAVDFFPVAVLPELQMHESIQVRIRDYLDNKPPCSAEPGRSERSRSLSEPVRDTSGQDQPAAVFKAAERRPR